MNILKTKKGFTLIELLVVIGILAVLAAIAIPSVAGLIDKANQSADQTNANEMTNAMERFVSEYELYRQDIMSNRIDFDNLDSTQGRVYNVTGAKSIEDIEALESEAGLDGIRIDIDSKYAQNIETTKAIIENYTKTSSTTFEPKQSDMSYWYNANIGYTVVTNKNASIDELFRLIPVELLKENGFNALSNWINLSTETAIPNIEVVGVSTYEGLYNYNYNIIFNLSAPDPNQYNIDLSKFYWISTVANVDNLNIENRTMHNTFSYNGYPNQYYENGTYHFSANFGFDTEANKNRIQHFRLCYEYEIDGEVKYIYSPTISCSYNDLNK